MGLLPHQVDEFVLLTQPYYEKKKWCDISLDYTEYVASRINDGKKVQRRGGPDIRHTLQVRNTGLARATGLFAQDVTGVEELTTQVVVPWVMATVNWSYDIMEPLFQSDPETIVDELQIREHACYNDLAELREQWLWSEPATSASGTAMGIPFWARKAASATAGTFGGGNPTGTGLTGGCGGVSTTTYPRWKNWHFTYTQKSLDDVVVKVKNALWNTKFKPPHKYPEVAYGPNDVMMFTTRRVTEPLERLAETRNDNLGPDLARYINGVTLGGVRMEAVHYLESNDTSDPIYGVNFRYFRPIVKRGLDMYRHPIKKAPLQRNVRTQHFDTAYNYLCSDRRQAVWVGHILT